MIMRFTGHFCTYCDLKYEGIGSKRMIAEHISSLEGNTRDYIVGIGATVRYTNYGEESRGTVIHCVRDVETHNNIYKVRPDGSPFWHSISVSETDLILES